MDAKSRPDEGGFRWLLVLGAVVSIIIAVWGLVWTGMLETALGVTLPRRALGIARMFGAVMLAIGIGYALAAAQPQRSRSLLVPLFVVPLAMAAATIAGITQGEISGGKGAVFIAYNVAFALLFFRLYPRVIDEIKRPTEEPPPT